MAYKRFSAYLAVRIAILGALLLAVVLLLRAPGYHSLSLIAVSALVISVAELWWFVTRTNREVARFLDAARHADFSQRFDFENVGAGFGELGQTFTEILERIREARTGQELETRRLRALIEHIPVPLLTLHSDNAVTLQNNAARRLFGAAHLTQLKDLLQFGASFHDAVAEAVPGARELVAFAVDGIDYQLTLATTEIVIAGESDRLISLQDIQTELDLTEAQAWQDLVRVLTHEIMNSITPVTSLAATAEHLVEDALEKIDDKQALRADLGDLRDAVATVARRSDSLTQFVNSYRQLTRLAPPEKKRVAIADLFETVATLAHAEWQDDRVSLRTTIDPAGLDVYIDRDLLEPVLLNLLRNAWQATQESADPEISLSARLNRRGNAVIEVSDNGPGVAADIATRIFVPFFTTKQSGSGVGLALGRQVMTAHGGFIRLAEAGGPGATFTLTF